jgi:hypothetical protein
VRPVSLISAALHTPAGFRSAPPGASVIFATRRGFEGAGTRLQTRRFIEDKVCTEFVADAAGVKRGSA